MTGLQLRGEAHCLLVGDPGKWPFSPAFPDWLPTSPPNAFELLSVRLCKRKALVSSAGVGKSQLLKSAARLAERGVMTRWLS